MRLRYDLYSGHIIKIQSNDKDYSIFRFILLNSTQKSDLAFQVPMPNPVLEWLPAAAGCNVLKRILDVILRAFKEPHDFIQEGGLINAHFKQCRIVPKELFDQQCWRMAQDDTTLFLPSRLPIFAI